MALNNSERGILHREDSAGSQRFAEVSSNGNKRITDQISQFRAEQGDVFVNPLFPLIAFDANSRVAPTEPAPRTANPHEATRRLMGLLHAKGVQEGTIHHDPHSPKIVINAGSGRQS